MPAQTDANPDDFFLPDFCSAPVVFGSVLLAELFAIILALSPGRPPGEFWSDLALISLFMQWVTLSGIGLLCLLRRWLARLGQRSATAASYGMLLLITLIFSEVGFRLAFPGAEQGARLAFLGRNLLIGAIVAGLLLRYFQLHHEWRVRLKWESEARIQALQARIRPHFLFNSLNTIANLTRSNPVEAERGIEDLADLFRASLSEGKRLIPLEEELELTRRYLRMEQLRMGDRLGIAWEVESLPGDALLPPLTLQPLLENAVYHGIEPLAGGGTVRVVGRRSGEALTLEITNPTGDGAMERHEGNRMAVENVRARLAAHFGGEANLESEQTRGSYRVLLQLPYRKGTR